MPIKLELLGFGLATEVEGSNQKLEPSIGITER